MADLRALHARAAQHQGAGRLAEAESVYRQILAAAPDDAEALHGLGAIALSVNQPAPAIALISRAVGREPGNALFQLNLGIAYAMSGQNEQAGQAFRAAVAAAPGDLQARYNLGLHLLHAGKATEAAVEFRRVIDRQPQNTDALMNLGLACVQAGDLKEATQRLRRAVQLAPGNMEARSNLANVLYQSQAFADAEAHYRAILAQYPNHVATIYNLANLLRDTDRDDDAEARYRHAIALAPKAIEPRINLGDMLKLQRKWDEAEREFQAAVAAQPDSSDAWRNLAGLDAANGRADKAADEYSRALSLNATDTARLQDALHLPIIVSSVDQIAFYRQRMAEKLARLSEDKIRIDDPLRVGARPFHLAYHGLDDRPLMDAVGRLYRDAAPSLSYVAPHCENYGAPDGRRLRIGFVSAYFHHHTIARLNAKLITGLPRERFDIHVFSFSRADDDMVRHLSASADAFVRLPRDLDEARRRIAEAQLDILYFTDIGMEAFSYFLAFARLAPVQCVTWGHPVTTGISTVDYFISSELFETPGSQAYYGETLVRFASPDVAMPDVHAGRPPGGGPTFLCPQSLFKFHPDLDPLIGEILKRCPAAEFVVIEGENPHWRDLLEARWRKSIPQVVDRIRAVPRTTPAGFIDLLAGARVSLDTPHFCGGMTSYETMAVGTPVVTLPGSFIRGRLTTGFYAHMDVTDLVADNGDTYVEQAVRLAQDGAYHRAMSERIVAAVPKMTDDCAPIDEHSAFFERAVAAATKR